MADKAKLVVGFETNCVSDLNKVLDEGKTKWRPCCRPPHRLCLKTEQAARCVDAFVDHLYTSTPTFRESYDAVAHLGRARIQGLVNDSA